jgi:SSS family transporter
MNFQTLLIFFVVIYIFAVIAIGYWSMRKVKNEFDYLTASQSIGPWVGGASLAATQMSAGTYIGLIGTHYLFGNSWIWVWPGIWVGYLITIVVVAPRMRAFATRSGGMTVPDFISARYNSTWVRGIAALLIVMTYTLMMGAQYQGGGVMLQTITGLPAIYGIVIMLAATVTYAALGGMRATAYTDFIQQLIMTTGIVIGLPLLIIMAGGWPYLTGLWDTIIQPPHTTVPQYTGFHWDFNPMFVIGATVAFLFTFSAAPYEMTRYYSMKDNRTVRWAAVIALLFQIPVCIAGAILGMTMRSMFPNMISGDASSTVFASSVMPPLVGVLVVLAVLAAIMSSVASIMIVSGAALARDVYGKIINPAASEITKLRVNRFAVVFLGVVPLIIANMQLDIVQFVVVAQAAIFGSFFFVPVIVGMLWKRGTTAGAITAMLSGFVTVVTIYALGLANQPWVGHPVFWGAGVSAVFYVVVSLMTQPVDEQYLALFFRDIRSKLQREGRYNPPQVSIHGRARAAGASDSDME